MSSDRNQDSYGAHRNYDEDFPPLNHLEVPTLPSIRSLLGPQRSVRRGGTAGTPSDTRPVRRSSRRTGDARRNPNIPTWHDNAWYEYPRPSGQSWEEGNAHLHLRHILRQSNNNSSPGRSPTPNMTSTHRPHDLQEDSRRTKRRKVDSDRLVPDFGGFRYGKYGQVEPGPLTMDIVSCDSSMSLEETSYAAESILNNDGSSVYCTKGNRCNIVLRHQGATVFNLTELVVKAPSFNYSSPIREGLVFVSMNHDDSLSRTAQYQIPYSAKPLPQTGAGSEDTVGERGLRLVPPTTSSLRRRPGTVEVRRRPANGALETRRRNSLFSLGLDDSDVEDEDEDEEDEDDEEEEEEEDEDEDEEDDEDAVGGRGYRLAHVPREFATTSLPPFNVTTECSDDEGLDSSFRLGRNAPNRIGSLPFESDESDDGFRDADDPFFDEFNTFGGSTFGLGGASSLLDDEPARAPEQEAGRGASGSSGEDLMVPHARFSIEKGRSKCTIHFDPPISGRYILLKMWSPRQHASSNIGIQSVMAKGFAGPRYFPSVSLA
ncbi:uncharacterized protein DNG_01427 [Cephalotrichum gorgonifer]|uniref:Uncharacterized protein n=1 Tax=Cephalotrichum gorgonifer TaxID=2041049 RepID=A0AAE8MRM0_9PEZI|nr:uncharacterized protein DNG_01427 [Cephalotrichum gorgonifer]